MYFMPKINQKQSDGNKIALKPYFTTCMPFYHSSASCFTSCHNICSARCEICIRDLYANCRISKYHSIYYAYEPPSLLDMTWIQIDLSLDKRNRSGNTWSFESNLSAKILPKLHRILLSNFILNNNNNVLCTAY